MSISKHCWMLRLSQVFFVLTFVISKETLVAGFQIPADIVSFRTGSKRRTGYSYPFYQPFSSWRRLDYDGTAREHHCQERSTVLKSTKKDIENDDDSITTTSSSVTKDIDPLTKTSWYAVELFGKVFGQKGKKESSSSTTDGSIDLDVPPVSVDETIQRIKMDTIDRSYFLSGQVDTLIYDSDCVFADPFVSFSGRDRFVENLSNLGSFVTKYDAKLLELDSSTSTSSSSSSSSSMPTVRTKLMVKLELNLPWKPVLAWPWGVTYEIDPITNLIVTHNESWDIEPLEGVKQIFRKPTVSV